MHNTLINIAEIHYEYGIINFDELNERVNIALWLSDKIDIDPRNDSEDTIKQPYLDDTENNLNQELMIDKTDNSRPKLKNDENRPMCIYLLGVWVFTKSDPDSYPSIPHGHFKNQNRKWPKLNPYNGCVFTSKNQEDKSKRLKKTDMKRIWTDEKFKSFCREMIVWYIEQFPCYSFPVPRPLRFPRW